MIGKNPRKSSKRSFSQSIYFGQLLLLLFGIEATNPSIDFTSDIQIVQSEECVFLLKAMENNEKLKVNNTSISPNIGRYCLKQNLLEVNMFFQTLLTI